MEIKHINKPQLNLDSLHGGILEKAYQEGVYSDTPKNRKLGIVGMSYKKVKEFLEKKKEEGKRKDVESRVNKEFETKSKLIKEDKEDYGLVMMDENVHGEPLKNLKKNYGIKEAYSLGIKTGKTNNDIITIYASKNKNGDIKYFEEYDDCMTNENGLSIEDIKETIIEKKLNGKYTEESDKESEERVRNILNIAGITFKKVGEHSYYRDPEKKIGDYKAIGPTGNVIFTNDYNHDLSTSLPNDYLVYDSTRNELKPAEYIRLKDWDKNGENFSKVKDYFDGKISIEDAESKNFSRILIKKGSEKEKKYQKIMKMKPEERREKMKEIGEKEYGMKWA